MKISNKKIIVSTLALAMGAALAGSISGSVAWYQYSTRASAFLTGTAIGSTRELQISNDGSTFTQHIANLSADAKFKPLSVAASDGAVSKWYEHPVYQYASLPEAASTATAASLGYLEQTISFKLLDRKDSAEDPTETADKVVYITKLNITGDMADAVRVAIDGDDDYIFATSASTATKGNLDLNGNTKADTAGLDQQDTTGTAIDYINGAQESYATTLNTAAVEFSDPYTAPSGALAVGKTGASITLKIWLEGWQNMGGTTSVWDVESTMLKQFKVEMRFEVLAEK